MATITNSEIVRSVSDSPGSDLRRNLYRFTLDDASVHDVQSWIPSSVSDAADMAAREAYLLEQLVQAEIEALLNG